MFDTVVHSNICVSKAGKELIGHDKHTKKNKAHQLGRMIRITEFGLREKFYFAKILGFAWFFARRCWVSL